MTAGGMALAAPHEAADRRLPSDRRRAHGPEFRRPLLARLERAGAGLDHVVARPGVHGRRPGGDSLVRRGAYPRGPSIAAQTAVQQELASGDGVPTEVQRRRLEWADRRMRLANRVDLPLLLLAGLTMAVGRYL
jgi:hypothetical protein